MLKICYFIRGKANLAKGIVILKTWLVFVGESKLVLLGEEGFWKIFVSKPVLQNRG